MRTIQLNTGVRFKRQYKQPFETKEYIAEILVDEATIKIHVDKAASSVMKRLSDELVQSMLCESTEYKEHTITMVSPDWALFNIEELKEFITEFMKEYHISINYNN